jgi:ribosomal protein L7/L12
MAKDLQNFKTNQEIAYYGEKFGVGVLDGSMVVGLALGVGEEYFAGRLATRQAMLALTKETLVAGSGICNSAAGRANPVTNAIERLRGLYFVSHMGVGSLKAISSQIKATETDSNMVQKFLRTIAGDRRIAPVVAENYDPSTAPSLTSMFSKKIEFDWQSPTGNTHRLPAYITQMDPMTRKANEIVISNMQNINGRMATVAFVGLTAEQLKQINCTANDQQKNHIDGDTLFSKALLQELVGQCLDVKMQIDQDRCFKQENSSGTKGTEPASADANKNDKTECTSAQDDDRRRKIEALNVLQTSLPDDEAKSIIEDTKKLLAANASKEDIDRFKGKLASKLVLDGDTLARAVNFNVLTDDEEQRIIEDTKKQLFDRKASSEEVKEVVQSLEDSLRPHFLSAETVNNLNNPDNRSSLSPSVQRFLSNRPPENPNTKIAAEAALVALSEIMNGRFISNGGSDNAQVLATASVEVPTRTDLDCPRIRVTEAVDADRVL